MPDDRATATLAELDALRAEVADLRRQLARQGSRRLTDDDRRRALLLIPVVAGIVGARSFVVAELLRWAASDLRGAGELRRGFESATGPLDDGTGRRIGKLFKRLNGSEVAGVVVARIGAESSGCVWSLRPAGFPEPETPAADGIVTAAAAD